MASADMMLLMLVYPACSGKSLGLPWLFAAGAQGRACVRVPLRHAPLTQAVGGRGQV